VGETDARAPNSLHNSLLILIFNAWSPVLLQDRPPATRILPPIPYAVAIAGGWWLDRHVLALPFVGEAFGRWAGASLIATGILLFLWSFLTLRRHRTTVNPFAASSSLCTDGPYRLSRNPIYLGDWLVLIGAALMMGSAWPLLFTPVVWLVIRHHVIRHEEAHLEARFAEAYRAYCARVRRWL